MNTYSRFRNRWTVNECLQLQREFELLQMSIDDIALKHQRTPNAIMFKLDQEGFADYNELYSNYHGFSPALDMQPNLNNTSSNYFVKPEITPNQIQLETKIAQLEKQVLLLTQMITKSSGNNKLFM
jgi:hypothetical protein